MDAMTVRPLPLAALLMLAGFLALAPGTADAVPIPFDVYAQANSSSGGAGVDTGLFFDAGDFFTVSVDDDDLWNAGALPRWSNADGLIVDLFATGSDDSGQPTGTHIGEPFPLWTQNGLTAPFGSLVGSVGGTYFLLGTGFAGPAPASGNLLLYYWDSNNGDNTEHVTAFVDPNPAPEPATLVLFGLAALMLRPRRRA